MGKDKSNEFKQLKRDYFELMDVHRDERDALMMVINTFGLMASAQDDMEGDIQSVKGLIKPDGELPINEIKSGIRRIKDKIIAKENNPEQDRDESNLSHDLEGRVIDACRIIKRIMGAVLDDFYPMTEEMMKVAENIAIDCKEDVKQIDLKRPSEDLLDIIQKIKIKISEDFREINRTFFTLLEQVKDLEKSITSEFGGDKPIKEVEYFEMKITQEVGSIAESFNVYTTISEVKKVVAEKLKNIRSLVTKKKKEEIRKNHVALESIKTLKKRISEVEKKARKMSKKAEHFQKAAMRDGLTGLFSRSAFDSRIKETLNNFINNKETFSVILFDIDKFKAINDTLGHIAGDKVLKKVAECLEETFRKDDFISRYGGDEFVVVIEGFTEEMANERISIFNENLKKRRFVSYKEGEVNLTVSAGIAQAREGDTIEGLIARADKAMYSLKQKST